jgi:hypothetical protein
MASREQADLELALELRKQDKIIIPDLLFKKSNRQEVDSLIGRGVFKFELFEREIHGNTRIFKSRIVNEIKGKATNTLYKKSRLVIQGYNNEDKETIFIQSPTIQRASQRIIITLIPSFLQLDIDLWLRNITQAYTQLITNLNY